MRETDYMFQEKKEEDSVDLKIAWMSKYEESKGTLKRAKEDKVQWTVIALIKWEKQKWKNTGSNNGKKKTAWVFQLRNR